MTIIDRTNRGALEGGGDSFIVTGDIAPHFRPRLFSKYKDAVRYAKKIEKHEVFPHYAPTIEKRWKSDVPSLVIDDSLVD